MFGAKSVLTLSVIGLCMTAVFIITACGNGMAPATPPTSSAPTGGGAATLPAQPPVVSSGQRLYESNCAACHGKLGEGGKAPDGSIATPLSSHLRAHAGLEGGVQQIIRAVLDGVHEEAGVTRVLRDAMPRFKGKLSEAEVTEIISYMKALP